MNQFRFRTIGSSLALSFALLTGACSSSQSVTTEPVPESPSDTVLSDVSSGTAGEDGDIEPILDELAEPITDSVAEPEEWPEPLPEPQLEPEPEPEPEPGEHTAPYCAAYDRLEEAGGSTPTTPAEAEALLATMLLEVETVVATAPDNIAPSAAEMSKFIELIAEKAAAENWDPQWFEDLEDDVISTWGFDIALIEAFFDHSDDLCNDARTTPIPEDGDFGVPAPPVD